MTDRPGLRVEALVAGRPGFQVGPLSLVAPAGTRIAVIGRNGGGKTTLLKTLAGLLPPVGGRVAVDGEAPGAATAYLPPPGSLSVALPIAHVVALGRASRRGWAAALGDEDHRAARAALERLGIGELATRRFDQVSSGQQQLALIARLIVQEPALCLLDEPTAMLDAPHAAQVEQAMRFLGGEGRVVIAATHHLALAARADRVISVGATLGVDTPAVALSGSALTTLFGEPVDLCPCCHQPMSVATSN